MTEHHEDGIHKADSTNQIVALSYEDFNSENSLYVVMIVLLLHLQRNRSLFPFFLFISQDIAIGSCFAISNT